MRNTWVFDVHAYICVCVVGFYPICCCHIHKVQASDTEKIEKGKEIKGKRKATCAKESEREEERTKAPDLSTYVYNKIGCLCSFTRIICYVF